MRVLRRLAAALARADLAFDHDRTRAIDDVGGEERQQREDRSRRVAARAGQAPRALDAVPVKLGDAVHPAADGVRMWMRLAIPALVIGGVAESMVAREVDDQIGAPFELVGAVRTVRQAEEQHIAPLDVLVPDELQVRALPEVRMRRRDRLAGERLAPRDHLADLGMREQEAQQLTTGVPAGADDADLHRAAAASTKSIIFAGMFTPVVSMELRNSIV